MRWPLVSRSTLECQQMAMQGVILERNELRASLGLTKAALDDAMRQIEQHQRLPKADAALLDARQEIAHLQVDLIEARRTAKSAEVANRELMDTIRAHHSLGRIVAQFKPMLQRIAKSQPKPAKAPKPLKPPSRRAKQKGGAS